MIGIKKVFNLYDYDNKYVMYCETKEEAEEFCGVLHDNGMTWRSGASYATYNPLYMSGFPFYRFQEGTRCDLKQSRGYYVLNWSDFCIPELTKIKPKDLFDFLGM